jgi:hypothetical protein
LVLCYRTLKAPVQAILQGAGMREGRRDLADVWRNQKGWEIVRVSFDKTFQNSGSHIDLQHKISFLSRNGQHGMIQWIAVWFLPEAEGGVIGSPAVPFVARLDQ